MDNQKKLEMFEQKIYNEAIKNRDQITAKINRRVADDMEECENEALAEAYERIQRSRGEIRRETAEKVSTASFELRRSLIALRESLADGVFSDVEKKLDAFAKTEQYKEYLTKALDEAKALGKTLTAEVNSRDAERYAAFLTKNGVKKVTKVEIKGGIRVVVEDKGIVIDKSFDTALAEKRGAFNVNR